MSFVPLHRARLGLGSDCWIDIEVAHGTGSPLTMMPDADKFLAAEKEIEAASLVAGGIPPMCWREDEHLFEPFQLREDTAYFVDVATPYLFSDAKILAATNPGWPFSARLAKVFKADPVRRWREEAGGQRTIVTGQFRLRSHAGVLDLSTEFGGELRVEVACSKLNYFNEFKSLLDSLADKAAELLLSYDSPVSLSFSATNDLAANEAALYFLLRHVMAKSQLPTSIEEIFERPHRALIVRAEMCPIDEIEEIDPELLADGTDYHDLGRGGPLARLFRGCTPASLPQRELIETDDTPENRYAKAFLLHCSLLAHKLVRNMSARRSKAAEREAKSWTVALDEALQHGMWRDVGTIAQAPMNSPTLLRKRGYKDLLRYDLSLRMALSLSWNGVELADGLVGDIRPVNQIYEYWCFFVLREVLLSQCREVSGGNFLVVSRDGLKIQLARGQSSECRFEHTSSEGVRTQISLFYNKRFMRPNTPRTEWEGSYTSSFDPDFSLRFTGADGTGCVHWLHFDAKYRLQRRQAESLFMNEAISEQTEDRASNYEVEVSRVHKQEDLYKMHTYRDGILGSRGAYVLFPGDGVGGNSTSTPPNFFVRHPNAFGGGSSNRIPSVGVFDLSPDGDSRQTAAIWELLQAVIDASTSQNAYSEESAFFNMPQMELEG